MDLNKINSLLAENISTPQLDSLPNTIVTLEREEEPSATISALHRSIVTELHAKFMFTGVFLSLGQLKEKFPELLELSPVGLETLFQRVNVTLDKRGLPAFQIKFVKSEFVYDPDFVAACGLLADFSDKRPVGAKLKSIGISTAKWNNWLKIKKNFEYWHQIVDGLMDRNVYEEGRVALAQNVARGDLASIKYFNEMTDKFVASKDFDPRIIGVLMSGVLDIIMRHVDGTVASKIAEEIQLLGIGSLSGITGTRRPIEANSTVVDLD